MPKAATSRREKVITGMTFTTLGARDEVLSLRVVQIRFNPVVYICVAATLQIAKSVLSLMAYI